VHNRLSILLRLAAAATLSLWAAAARAQGHPTTLAATRAGGDLRAADQIVDAMIRDRGLVVRDVQKDTLLPDRVHERLDQYLRGVRIVGGDLTRQTAPDGTVSIFARCIRALRSISREDCCGRHARRHRDGSRGEATGPDAELVILPLSDGHHLAYRGQAMSASKS